MRNAIWFFSCWLGLFGASPLYAQSCQIPDQFRDGFEVGAGTFSNAPGLSAPPSFAVAPAVTAPLLMTGALAPTIQATSDGDWQNTATWGGRLPIAGDLVRIPRGRTVNLAGTTPLLSGLHVDGVMNFAQSAIVLRSRFIVVSGLLQAGTETTPYQQRAVIELHGTDEAQNVLGMGTKGIAVVSGGVLKLHGECRLSWTKMTASAAVGATQIQLSDSASSWRVGDQIVVVSSSFDPREAETLTITAVNGNQVSFSPALRFAHVGLMQSYEGKALDQRTAVGLLSRNIRIEGALDSNANAFGGHIMAMAGAHMQVSGVELLRMGQRGRFGRYPIHWHVAGDRNGNYLMSSSIHQSFQRAAVLHSTNYVTFDGNVAYNIKNHGFVWAEDGNEVGNTLTRNLAALISSPAPEHFAFPINNSFHGNNSQDEHRSSVYWGRSFDRMTITDNISAGVLDGFGFYFDLFSPAPFGSNEGTGLVFARNIAHSTYKLLATGNQINYPEATTGHALMISTGSNGTQPHIFDDFTAYHNISGAWVEDRKMNLRNSILADNGVGLLILRGSASNLKVIGDSANPTPLPQVFVSVVTRVRAAIQVVGSNHGGKRAPQLSNISIINQPGVGVLYDLDNISPAGEMRDLRFTNTPERIIVHHPINFEFPNPPSFGLTDPSGSLFGLSQASRLLRYDSPLIDASCQVFTASNAYRCAQTASLLLDSENQWNLSDSQGQMIFVRRFFYDDQSMPSQGTVSFLANTGVYEVSDAARTTQRFKLSDALAKSVEFKFAASGAPSIATHNAVNLLNAASLLALRTSTASGYFYSAAESSIFVRIVSNTEAAAVRIDAPFLARSLQGRAAIALPANAVDGYSYAAFASNASYQLRQTPAAGTPVRSGVVAQSQITSLNSGPILSLSVNGQSVTLSGYVFAPVSGIYRIGLWGDGGGTAAWIGDTWVMGEPYAFINSNWMTNNQLTTQVVAFQVNGQVALQAGWHPVRVVHAKFPTHNGGRYVHLRWATPANPNTWVYPDLKRAP